MKIEEIYARFRQSAGVNTDTRTLQPGQMYVALKGENFDGNAFAMKALEAGASFAVVNRTVPDEDPRLIKVDDTLQALKDLAALHRNVCLGEGRRLPVIGLTGTNGKTTTKELIRTVLAAKYKVVATEGNLNNEIGVPLSVLKFGPETEIGIIEMGASHPEDLRPLLAVAQPSHGLITNVGKAHLEGFGSFDGVKHAKGRLYDYLKEHAGTAFVNADDPVLKDMLKERDLKAVGYGVSLEGVKILPSSPREPFLRMELDGRLIRTHLVGAYNAANVLAALRIGRYFDVPADGAVAAIEAYIPSNNRSQLLKTERNSVIVDAYNANPSSMKVALDNLSLVEGRKVALLGDMRELGADSAAEHLAVVSRLEGLDAAFLVGEEFAKAAAQVKAACPVRTFGTSAELTAYLTEHPLEGCTVLVKGSHSTQMEKTIPAL